MNSTLRKWSRRAAAALGVQYEVFLSYRHLDRDYARAIQSALYRLGKPFWRIRAMRVFRDEDTMAVNDDLRRAIQQALLNSKHFVLIASPNAAKSEWVEREIVFWRTFDPPRPIALVLAAGAIVWNNETKDFDWPNSTAIPRALERYFTSEPSWADLRELQREELTISTARFRAEARKVAAAVRQKAPEDIASDELREYRRTIAVSWSTVLVLSVLLVTLLVTYLETRRQQWLAEGAAMQAKIAALREVRQANHAERASAQAQAEQRRAEEQARRAQARQMAIQSTVALSIDPENSFLLARESLRVMRTSEGEVALRRAVATGGIRTIVDAHRAPVRSLAVTPNGRSVATAGDDATVKIWSSLTGHMSTEIRRLSGVTTMCFSGDGTRLHAFGHDGVTAWNTKTGSRIAALEGTRYEHSGEFSADCERVATAGYNQTARVWRVSDGELLSTLGGHDGNILEIRFSSDGSSVLTIGVDQTACVWTAEGTLRAKLGTPPKRTYHMMVTEPDPNGITKAEITHDGAFVISAEGSKGIIWDVNTSEPVARLIGHADFVLTLAVSLDGQKILTADSDGVARLWRMPDGATVAMLLGHDGPIREAHFSSDGSWVITASDDGTARVWDAETGSLVNVLSGHKEWVIDARFNATSNLTATTISGDGTARVWRTGVGVPSIELRGHTGSLSAGAFSPDGKFIVTVGDSEPVGRPGVFANETGRVWTSEHGRPIVVYKGHQGRIWGSPVFSPDGTLIATSGADGTAQVWESRTGRSRFVLQHKGGVYSAAFSGDGKYIVTASRDRTARVWSVNTGSQVGAVTGHTDDVTGAEFSPDGEYVVTASADSSFRVWNVKSNTLSGTGKLDGERLVATRFSGDGREILVLGSKTFRIWEHGRYVERVRVEGFPDGVSEVVFSKDRAWFVATDSRTTRLWSAKPLSYVAELKGHTEGVLTAAFSSDGDWLATGGFDGTARVWRVETGQHWATLYPHDKTVWHVEFSPESSRLLVSGDKKAAVFELDFAQPLKWILEKKVPTAYLSRPPVAAK
jgi:WD40 repeat protein